MADQVHAAHASLWALTYQNAESARVRGKVGANREAVLSNLTKQSGGIRIPVPQAAGLDVQMKKVAEVLLGQYAVTYERPDGAAPKMLQMAVARPAVMSLRCRCNSNKTGSSSKFEARSLKFRRIILIPSRSMQVARLL